MFYLSIKLIIHQIVESKFIDNSTSITINPSASFNPPWGSTGETMMQNGAFPLMLLLTRFHFEIPSKTYSNKASGTTTTTSNSGDISYQLKCSHKSECVWVRVFECVCVRERGVFLTKGRKKCGKGALHYRYAW